MKVRSLESVRFSSYISFCNVLHICNMRVRSSLLIESTHSMIQGGGVISIGTVSIAATGVKIFDRRILALTA